MLYNYVNYQSGSLIQRLEIDDTSKQSTYVIYDQTLLDIDLGKQIDTQYQPRTIKLKDPTRATFVKPGDIVISMITGECAMVSAIYQQAILPYNYTKVTVESDDVDAGFLVYWFQESPEAKRQFHQYMQGGSTIKKLTHQQLKRLEITLPTITRQRLIGRVAQATRRLNILKQKEIELKNQFLAHTLFKGDK
ncbi:restriction endonuclease subunit S [Mammaliicoccus sciuri]|uniref:restriction endonuclease subunit S n=1 Tax=Mammaliicoccus sciuri TaxID=1296 RepID=UPI001E4BA1D3|nr:restriction endonuclease subunit S [Mammaliicoccus sciuri]